MWNLSGSGFEPMSPGLAGGFFTTQMPGKPCHHKFLLFIQQIVTEYLMVPGTILGAKASAVNRIQKSPSSWTF